MKRALLNERVLKNGFSGRQSLFFHGTPTPRCNLFGESEGNQHPLHTSVRTKLFCKETVYVPSTLSRHHLGRITSQVIYIFCLVSLLLLSLWKEVEWRIFSRFAAFRRLSLWTCSAYLQVCCWGNNSFKAADVSIVYHHYMVSVNRKPFPRIP